MAPGGPFRPDPLIPAICRDHMRRPGDGQRRPEMVGRPRGHTSWRAGSLPPRGSPRHGRGVRCGADWKDTSHGEASLATLGRDGSHGRRDRPGLDVGASQSGDPGVDGVGESSANRIVVLPFTVRGGEELAE